MDERDGALPALVPGDVGIGRLGDEPIGGLDLAAPRGPCLLDDLGIADRTIAVSVLIVL